MKILLLCREYPPAPHGGTGAFVRDYASALADAGHDVVVLAGPVTDPNAADDPLRAPRVVRLRFTKRGPDFLDAVRYALAVRKSVAQIQASEHFAVIEAPSHGGEHAFLPKLMYNTVIVTRLHGLLFVTPTATPVSRTWNPLKALYRAVRSTVFRALELRAISRSSGLVFLTEHYRQFTLSVAPRLNSIPACVVPNGLVRGQRSIAGYKCTLDRPAVAYAGRISRSKGVDTLLEAAENMQSRYPGLTWYLFGRVVNPDLLSRPPGKVLVDRGVVKLLGPQPREFVRACLETVNIVVFPSRYEAFGLVPLESMEAGTLVIASDLPSNREIIGPSAGILFPTGDASALASAVAWALDNPQEAHATALAGKQRATKLYSMDRTLADSLMFYSTLRARPEV